VKITQTLFLLFLLIATRSHGQEITWEKQRFMLKNVTGAVVSLEGEQVLKLERDLVALPFDVNRMEATVDEPTYARLADLNFTHGVIEVKVRSQLQNPSPFEQARGFIGVAFRISKNNSAFEAIYLRPTNGRADNPLSRSRAVQYFAYPDYKFGRLRRESPGKFEAAAPIGLDEWITLRIAVEGQKVSLFINDAKEATLVVNKMLGRNTHGAIALWVDIGTIGYFKDFKVTKR
jgi:hypothetical protein